MTMRSVLMLGLFGAGFTVPKWYRYFATPTKRKQERRPVILTRRLFYCTRKRVRGIVKNTTAHQFYGRHECQKGLNRDSVTQHKRTKTQKRKPVELLSRPFPSPGPVTRRLHGPNNHDQTVFVCKTDSTTNRLLRPKVNRFLDKNELITEQLSSYFAILTVRRVQRYFP